MSQYTARRTPELLAARAAYVLRDNSTGKVTKAAPRLYPHQWSWDAAFNAIGLACVDPPRARLELDSLLAGQWRNGMVPHIVFDPAATGYFPGPDRWNCAAVTDQAPADVPTSGICQPPVHAIAVARIIELAGRDDAETGAWVQRVYPKVLAWHRFLARERLDPGTGLITIFHGWESGMDNSPRWDAPYDAVTPGTDLPEYTRRDTAHVADAGQRPSDREYDRYLWLLHEARRAGYDSASLRSVSSFAAADVLFTAIFAAASEQLATVARWFGQREEAELRDVAARTRSAVFDSINPSSGLAADANLRTGQWLPTETIAGFAPLIAGQLPDGLRERQVALLTGPRWAGHQALRWPLPPSTSPCSDAFRPRAYWRGPVWPVISWLLGWALRRAGESRLAADVRAASLAQLSDMTFAEYYDPLTGAPLGSRAQSWTASVGLDWITESD